MDAWMDKYRTDGQTRKRTGRQTVKEGTKNASFQLANESVAEPIMSSKRSTLKLAFHRAEAGKPLHRISVSIFGLSAGHFDNQQAS
eukprot:scaffold135049_cov30-Prasinocladus_malaysianus.AAC.1